MQCTPPAWSASKRLVSVCLFRASSSWFFSPGTPASFHKVKTRLRPLHWHDLFVSTECTVRKLTLYPTIFWEFLTVHLSRCVVGLSQALGVEPPYAGYLIQQQQRWLAVICLNELLSSSLEPRILRPILNQY